MLLKEITSSSNSKIKNLIKLLNNKERSKKKLFLSSDLNLIKKAYKNNLLVELYSRIDLSLPYIKVDKSILDKITNNDYVGVISFIKENNTFTNKIIYLDEISDPSNLGKIIYLMDKYKYKDLVLSKNSVSIYNNKCLEIIKDKLFNVNVHYQDITFLKKMKGKYQIISTGLRSSKYLDDLKVKDKFILVFGNESRGVNKNILDISDEIIKIKIKNIDSLNVSIASSIVLDNIK